MKRRRRPYKIAVSPEADEHLAGLTARERSTAVSAMEQQLVHEPMIATRNRKPLRPNPVAPWVLRVSHLRVYFEVKGDPERVVTVRAIGVKLREQVTIGGVEVDLS